jgi:hypothetical protein
VLVVQDETKVEELNKQGSLGYLPDATPGLALQWRDIMYDVIVDDPNEKGKKITKPLIHPMSGEVKPGEMCAIMGSSGAG